MIWLLLLLIVAGSVLSQRGARWTGEALPLDPGLCLALLALVTVWAYRSVWTAGYVYEDAAWLPFWNAPEQAGAASLAYLPWQVGTWLSGGLPRAYHILAVAVHIVNGLLLYRLLRRFGLIAVLVVGLFWLAPVNSEAVAYLSGAREAYVTFWVLLGVTCADGSDWQVLRIGGMLLCAAVALASKSSGIVALALVPYGGFLVNPSLMRRFALPSLILAGLVGVPAVLYVLHLQSSEGIVAVHLHGLIPYAALTSAAIVRYLSEAVIPVGMTLDHDWFAVASIWPTVALLSVAVGSYVLWTLRREMPLLAAGWLWLLLALAPRFVVQQSEVLNEHQIYLAFLPVWIGLGLLLEMGNVYVKDLAYGW